METGETGRKPLAKSAGAWYPEYERERLISEYIKEEQSVDICGRSSSRDGDVPLWGETCPLYLLKGGQG